MFLRELQMLQGSAGYLLCGAVQSPWACDVAVTWQSSLNVVLWEGLLPRTQQAAFAWSGTKPSFTFTPLLSVFSHALCKTSLSSFKPLLPLSRFLSTAAPPWDAAPSALEQTTMQLTAAAGYSLSLPEVHSKGPWIASSIVIPLGRQSTHLHSYPLGLHKVWDMGSNTIVFLASGTLLPAWMLWTHVSQHNTAIRLLKSSVFCICSRLNLPNHLHWFLDSRWLSLVSEAKATPWPWSGKNTNFIERLRLPSKCIAFAAFQCPWPLKGSPCSLIAT